MQTEPISKITNEKKDKAYVKKNIKQKLTKIDKKSLIPTLCTGYSDKKAFRACHSSKYSKTFDSLPEHLVHEWSRLHGTNILRTIFSQIKKTTAKKKTTL